MASGVKGIIVALVFALGMLPGLAEARSVHFIPCANCHRGGFTMTDLKDGTLCMSCHDPGKPATTLNDSSSASPNGRFVIGDGSNAMGSNAANAIKEISHMWGVNEINPAAGAQLPTINRTQFDGKYGISRGMVACSRCHNPHGDNADTTILKVDNTTDGMCTDCHLPWNVANTDALETHPAGIDYATFEADTARFKAAADIPTAPGDVRLVGGKVSCTSCHNVHFADSDSSTPDGVGILPGGAQGDGHLLRSDGPLVTGPQRNGADGTAQLRSNLCQACHTYQLHGKGTDDHRIGCLECHGGHSYNGGTPNPFVLRADNPDVPVRPAGVNGGTASVTFGTYTAGANTRIQWADNVNGTANGYCEQCHGDVNDPGGIGGLELEHLTTGLNPCSSCHKHNDPAAIHSFNVDASAATCGACHGFPPHLSGRGDRPPDGLGVDGGYAWNNVDTVPVADWDYFNDSGYYKDEATTAHNTHAGNNNDPNYYFVGNSGIENCRPCHGDTAGSGAGGHREPGNTETFRNVPFDSTVATAGGNLSPVYNTGSATCDNVYCHTNGTPRTGDGSRDYSGVNITPAWALEQGGGKDAIFAQPNRCSFCHGNDATSMSGPFDATHKNNSVAHLKHLSAPYNYDCNVCHVLTASSSSALQAGATDGRTGGTHVNSLDDVAFDGAYNLGAGLLTFDTPSYNSTTGVCAVYCHSDGAAVPTYAPVDWDYGVGGALCGSCHVVDNTLDTGSHPKHIGAAFEPQLSCDACHGTGAAAGTHAGHVDGAVTLEDPDGAGPLNNTCEECHGWDAGEALPEWGNADSADCVTCHGGATVSSFTAARAYAAKNKTTAFTTGHNKASGFYPDGLGGNGNAAANLSDPAATVNGGCEACHNKGAAGHFDGDSTDKRLRTDNGFPASYAGNENVVCDSCHGTSPTNPWAGGVTGINTHQVKQCVACHEVHGDDSGNDNIFMVRGGSSDYNGTVVFTARGDSASPLTAADSYDEDDDGSTSTHVENNADDLCATCHSNPPTTHNNRQNDQVGHNQGTDCFDCHNPHTDATDAFGGGAGNSCDSCHGFPPTTGAHAVHTLTGSVYKEDGLPTFDVSDCGLCHGNGTNNPGNGNNNIDNYTYNGSGDQGSGENHADESGRRAILAETVGYAKGAGNKWYCSTACHDSSATDGFWYTWDDVGQPTLDESLRLPVDSDGIACTSCHGYTQASGTPIVTSSHNAHVNVSTKACSECHGAEESQGPGELTHINIGTGADDGAKITDRATPAAGEAGVSPNGMNWSNPTCTSTGDGLGCHATGGGSWGTPTSSDNCVECHTDTTNANVNPTSGLHGNTSAPTVTGQSHDQSVPGGCEACHTASPTTTAADHRDGIWQSSSPQIRVENAGQNLTFTDGATPTCTTDCHSAGTAWIYLWTSDAYNALGGVDLSECNGCHGTYGGGWNTGVIHTENASRGSGHNTKGTLDYPCTDCHAIGASTGVYDWTQPWDPTGTNSSHGDGNLQVNYNSTVFTENAGRAFCNNGTCHGQTDHDFPASTAFATEVGLTGDTPQISCGGCHGGGITIAEDVNYWPDGGAYLADDQPGRHQAHMEALASLIYGETADGSPGNDLLRTTGNGDPKTKQQALCDYCHDYPDGTHGQTSYLPADLGGVKMVDGTVAGVADAGAAFNWDGNVCSNTDCHFEKATTGGTYGWYDAGTSDCAMCHDPDNVVNAVNSGGITHVAHTNASGNSMGPDVACSKCHDGATDWGLNVKPNDGNHINNTLEVAGSVSFTYSSNACGTNACHSNGQYSAGSPVAPKTAGYTWGTPIAGCDACHETTAANLTSGSHDQHLASAVQAGIACSNCHTSETAATHYDGNVDFTGNGANYNGGSPEPTSDETFSTCGTNTCHNRGYTSGSLVAPKDNSYTWNTNSGACDICHDNTNATLATDMHDEHLNQSSVFGISPDCANCHGSNAASGTHAGHVDASVTLSLAGTGYTGAADITDITASTYGTCDTSDCHNNGKGTAVPTPAWNDTPSAGDNCTLCHGNTGAIDAAHATHLGTVAYGPYPSGSTDCGMCHAAEALNTNISNATHINGTITFADASEFASGDIATDTTMASCNGCHGGLAAANVAGGAKKSWASASRLACETCHGDYTDAVIGGATAPHNAGTGASEFDQSGHGKVTDEPTYGGSSCTDCHDNTAAGHIDGVSGDDKRMRASVNSINYNSLSFCADACHSISMKLHYDDGPGAEGSYPPVGTLDCLTCHNPHGQNLDADSGVLDTMIKPVIDGKNIVGLYNTAVQNNYYLDPPNNGGDNRYGICQACHEPSDASASGGVVANFNRSIATPGHQGGGNCIGCHTHDADPAFNAAAAGCDSCHGDGAGNFWPDGLSGSPAYVDDEGAGAPGVLAHQAHVTAIMAQNGGDQQDACSYCHPDPGGSGHNTDSGDQTVDLVTTGNFKYLMDASLDSGSTYTASSRCSNINCHANAPLTPHWYGDSTAPATITTGAPYNLTAATGPEPWSVKLTWNAPGDDGGDDNTAYMYDIRMGTDSGTATNYGLTSNYAGGAPTVNRYSKSQELVVKHLDPAGGPYFFSIRTGDETVTAPSNPAGNWSAGSVAVSSGSAPDNVDPVFWGIGSASVADSSGSVWMHWDAAEDHSMPVVYDLFWSDAGINWGTPQVTGFTGTSYLVDGLTDGNLYDFAVRARDNSGNAETNTYDAKVTPKTPPVIAKTPAAYYSGGAATSPVAMADTGGSYGGTGSASAFPVSFAGPAYGVDTLVYPSSFAVYIRNGNGAGQVTVTPGYWDGSFTPFNGGSDAKVVPISSRAKRVFTFKFDGTERLVPALAQPAIQITDDNSTLTSVDWGTATERGDYVLEERVYNHLPTVPTLGAVSGNGKVTVSWTGSTDQDGGQTVHYDVYGALDAGFTDPFVVATGLDVATTSIEWDTLSDGIALGGAQTVYVKVEAGDSYGHSFDTTSWSLDNSTDTVAPAQILDLAAEPRPKEGSIYLTWTAPGDDEANNGTATEYDIRYSTSDITNGTLYNAATPLDAEPRPDFGGIRQGYEVLGLSPGTPYYFAMKTRDEDSNWSLVSNSAAANGGPKCGHCHDTPPSTAANAGNHIKHGYTVNDCENCHGIGIVSTYTGAHQDGQLKVGFKTATPVVGTVSGSGYKYTQGGFDIYDDNDGSGGFNASGGDNTDNGSCGNWNNLAIGGCHGPATNVSWDTITTLSCSNCHGDGGRTVDLYGRQHDATAANGGTPTDQVLASPPLDNHGYDGTSGVAAERKYVGKHDKHLNYSYRYSKGSSCRLCHKDNNHADGIVDIKLDTNVVGGLAHYNSVAGPGGCFDLSAERCHDSGGSTPLWDGDPNYKFNCVNCHAFGGTTPDHVYDPAGGIDIDNDADNTEGQMPGNCTWCHPAGHPQGTLAGYILIPNNAALGINYSGGGIHLRSDWTSQYAARGSATTEAGVCWGCHDQNNDGDLNGASDINEFGADNNPYTRTANHMDVTDGGANDYDFGTLSTASWSTATWQSANQSLFSYKNGAIQSTHTVNPAANPANSNWSTAPVNSPLAGTDYGYTEAPDAESLIRCSWCHDVHNRNLADNDTMTGAPFLRGTWKNNPYPEDGAPQSGTVYTAFDSPNNAKSYGPVPRGGVNYNQTGGYQIDQNNGYPTNGWTLGNSAGLCLLCHQNGVDAMDQTTGESLWLGSNGHANSAIGGSGAGAANILTPTIRNPGGWANVDWATLGNGDYGHAPIMGNEHQVVGGNYGYSVRGVSTYVDRSFMVGPNLTDNRIYDSFDWGVTQEDPNAVDIGYHAFSCSKCHNPHASRLPKLMITNCLDTNHNTWDNSYTLPNGSATNSSGNSLTAENQSVTLSNATSAQNCHRYRDRQFGNSTGNGWNKVTPWQEY